MKHKKNTAAEAAKKSAKPDTFLRYRYICTCCTGRATYARQPYFFILLICQNCGGNPKYLKENWVALDHNEFNSVNHL